MKKSAVLFAILLLIQSCTVYKSANVTLEQAAQNGSKTKVITHDGGKLKFKRIGFENEHYYGLKIVNKKEVKIYLDPNTIKTINEKNKTVSTILTIVGPVLGGTITTVAVSYFVAILLWIAVLDGISK